MSRFQIVQIPGWELLETALSSSSIERRLVAITKSAFGSSAPRDSVTPLRSELLERFRDVIAEARAAGAQFVCLPTQQWDGRSLPAAYTVATWVPPVDHDESAEALLRAILNESNGSARPETIDGWPAVRERSHQQAVDIADRIGTSAITVTWTIATPTPRAELLILTLSIRGTAKSLEKDANPIAALFDAHVRTIRFGPSDPI